MAKAKLTCKVESCAREARVKGLCGEHYQRSRRHGDPETRVRAKKVANASKLEWIAGLKVVPDSECIAWPFSVAAHGRGVLRYNGRLTSAPHAVALTFHGDPPEGAREAAHSCGNGHLGCVNPAHLRWASRSENEGDKASHGTVRKGSAINTSRLNEDDVRAIRASTDRGLDLAKRYGVHPSTVSEIRLRQSWAWLPD